MLEKGRKQLLIFTWGNNNGHVIHAVAFADEAKALGWNVTISLTRNESHKVLVERHGHTALLYPEEDIPKDFWTCWTDDAFVENAVVRDMEVIRATSADAVIHDIRMSTPIAAAESGVGCASILHQPDFPGFTFPELARLPLWSNSRAVEKTLQQYGQPGLKSGDIREVLVRDRVAIPSFPDFDPTTDEIPASSVHYVGPLNLPAVGKTAELGTVRHAKTRLFFYRVVGQGDSFQELCSTFSDASFEVFIATGSRDMAASLTSARQNDNIHISDLWDMESVLSQVDVVIHHGGPGTCLSALAAGLPSIILPGDHPERVLYANRMRSLGVAQTMASAPDADTDWSAAVDTAAIIPDWNFVEQSVNRLIGERDDAGPLAHYAQVLASLNLLENVERLLDDLANVTEHRNA